MNIQTSTAFNKQAIKTVFAIIVFVFTYLIILVGTIGITIGFGAFGIWLVTAQPMFLIAVAGLILVASGFLTLVYLIRYIFSTRKVDTSNLIEIRKEDEPELFNFIREIAVETGAKFPKKIFLVREDNGVDGQWIPPTLGRNIIQDRTQRLLN
ncbi:MAG: hypothetical protein LBE37_01470 [Sphingobacterium sp.]|jgi:hypothetical protein|nr:hypothetical protein [Sphingobacterium sp.]